MTEQETKEMIQFGKFMGWGTVGLLNIGFGLSYMYDSGKNSQIYTQAITAYKTLEAVTQEIREEKTVSLDNITSMRTYLTDVKLTPNLTAALKNYNLNKTIPTASNALKALDCEMKTLADTKTGDSEIAKSLGYLAMGVWGYALASSALKKVDGNNKTRT